MCDPWRTCARTGVMFWGTLILIESQECKLKPELENVPSPYHDMKSGDVYNVPPDVYRFQICAWREETEADVDAMATLEEEVWPREGKEESVVTMMSTNSLNCELNP